MIMNKLWGLGIGDWGLGNPQSPIPNPQITKQQYNNFKVLITINYYLMIFI